METEGLAEQGENHHDPRKRCDHDQNRRSQAEDREKKEDLHAHGHLFDPVSVSDFDVDRWDREGL